MGRLIQFPERREWVQGTLDGRVVKHPAPTGLRLGPHERGVLRALGYGSLTSTQAGKICHETRGHCFNQVPYGTWNQHYHRSRKYGGVNYYKELPDDKKYRGEGCCPGACLEGTEVMKRLKRRGFVDKIGGLWYAAEAWRQSWKESV